MADWRNYLEGDYDGRNIIEQESQVIEDVFTAEEVAAEVKRRFEEYKNSEKMKEYLIDGAVLMCDKATTNSFHLLGEEIELDIDVAEDKEGRKQSVLHIKKEDGKMSVGKSLYATVLDSKKGELSELKEKENGDEGQSYQANVYPFRCNCLVEADREAEKEIIKANKEKCKKEGVCQYLMRLNETWENLPSGQGRFYEKRLVKIPIKTKDGQEKNFSIDAECITMTSMLFCKHGGLITPMESGQIGENSLPSQNNMGGAKKFSKKGLMALMEFEVLNQFTRNNGYLVIKDKKLIAIKPHIAGDKIENGVRVGDGTITVGFGDSLQGDDLEYYKNNGIYLSKNIANFDEMKDIEIPVLVCFNKLLKDTNDLCQRLLTTFGSYPLTQNQLDALIFAKYQCDETGTRDAVLAGAGWNELYNILLLAHSKGGNGDFRDRTTVELNIYFKDNYDVPGGLKDEVIVEPWENYTY